MKAMKNIKLNRVLGSMKRKPGASSATPGAPSDPELDTPEANAARNVKLFCESGGPDGQGEEVLFLPTIVESCDASPQAAKETAYTIRKFLSKDLFSKPYVQYNSIMLIRILADNPGRTFTRNVDEKFVTTVQNLLRNGRDPSVKQILMETLDTFQRNKADDEGLAKLNEMWKAERERMIKIHGPGVSQQMVPPGFTGDSQNYFSRAHRSRSLPSPHELSSRIEEAKTSAQLLSQTVQSTPPSELLNNELVREFADRCQSASRSIQAYMVAENPSPDNDTMETLIDTNQQLQQSMSQHQRAVLHARKIAGIGATPTPPPTQNSAFGAPPRTESGFAAPPPPRTESGFAAPPPGPPPGHSHRKEVPPAPAGGKPRPRVPPPGDFVQVDPEDERENPFSDPTERRAKVQTHNPPFPVDSEPKATGQFNDSVGAEPWHPGFKETQSYVGRQDSAIGNATMHAAVGADVDRPGKVIGLTEREQTAERRRRMLDSDDEDEGEYMAPPAAGTKAPVYRY